MTLPTVTGTLLDSANNLSDLANAATARTNLGLGALATENALTAGQLPGLASGDFWLGNGSGAPTAVAMPGAGSLVLSGGNAAPTGLAPSTNGDCAVVASGAWALGSCGSGSFSSAVNRITSGTTNTLSSISAPFTTELWVSASAGAKIDTVPGCGPGINGDYLVEVDGEGNAATNPLTVTVASGTIGPAGTPAPGNSFGIFANGGAAVFQCDGAETHWALVATSQGGQNVNYQTGTSYMVDAQDNSGVVDLDNSAAIAVSLPQAGTTGFPLGSFSTLLRASGGGTVTVTTSQDVAPAAPTLSTQTTGGNGSLAASTPYYVVITAVDAAGATTASSNATVTTGAGTTNQITVTLPALSGDITGFEVYAGTASGGPFYLQSTGGAVTGSFVFGTSAFPLQSSGTQPSGTNTTASRINGSLTATILPGNSLFLFADAVGNYEGVPIQGPLGNSGVTAGSYTSANITVNAQGLVTAASNGSGGGGGQSVTSLPADSTSFSQGRGTLLMPSLGFSGGSGLSLFTGTIYYLVFYNPIARPVTTATLQVDAAYTGGTSDVYVWLYSLGSTGLPNSLVADFGQACTTPPCSNTSLAATGAIQTASHAAVNLTANTYYIVGVEVTFSGGSGSPTLDAVSQSGIDAIFGSFSGSVPISMLDLAGSYTSAPATAPAPTAGIGANSNAPLEVWVK